MRCCDAVMCDILIHIVIPFRIEFRSAAAPSFVAVFMVQVDVLTPLLRQGKIRKNRKKFV